MFNFIRTGLSKIYQNFTAKIGSFFTKTVIDKTTLKELELLLLAADTGVNTTTKLINNLEKSNISNGNELYLTLKNNLLAILNQTKKPILDNDITIFVGINGSGKTTTIAKLAVQLQKEGKHVLIVAADTFRAAAVEQLQEWADRFQIPLYKGTQGQDPAAVVFGGCVQFKQEKFDHLLIDTAGRLQTRSDLMQELSKIKRVINKQLPHHKISTLLTIDSMLGQNSFEQARIFKEATNVDGIILTKMDGTGKGGIVFAIADQLEIPVNYITFGETVNAIKPFDATLYVNELLSKVE